MAKAKSSMSCGACSRTCPSCMLYVLGLLLGITFLASNLGWIASSTANLIWPIIVILAAIIPMIKGMCK